MSLIQEALFRVIGTSDINCAPWNRPILTKSPEEIEKAGREAEKINQIVKQLGNNHQPTATEPSLTGSIKIKVL